MWINRGVLRGRGKHTLSSSASAFLKSRPPRSRSSSLSVLTSRRNGLHAHTVSISTQHAIKEMIQPLSNLPACPLFGGDSTQRRGLHAQKSRSARRVQEAMHGLARDRGHRGSTQNEPQRAGHTHATKEVRCSNIFRLNVIP